MIIWTPTVLSALYACVLCFCIWTCSAQLSRFHMERRSRNTLIIIIIKAYFPCPILLSLQWIYKLTIFSLILLIKAT